VFTNDDPLNKTDSLGLDPSLYGIETNSQVAEVGVAYSESKAESMEATTKALVKYINSASEQISESETKLSSACAPGTNESNCESTAKKIATLSNKANNALEDVGPYAVSSVALLKAAIQVANSLPIWIDSNSVMENSLGSDMQEVATVNVLTDTASLGQDLAGLADAFNNFLGDTGGDL
jgi:hypothetical protein